MKRNAMFARIMALLCAVVLLCSIGGVWASFHYDQDVVYPVSQTIELSVFPWTGSDILPEDSESGENHLALIDAIINDPTLGLNTANSTLNQEITDRWTSSSWLDPKRKTIGSMSRWDGGDLDKLFNTESDQLEFLLEFLDEDNDGTVDAYYLYTTNIQLTFSSDNWMQQYTPNIPIGETIYPVYRTRVERNSYGEWSGVETKVGSSKSVWYDAGTVIGGVAKIPSIGYGSDWQEETGSTQFGSSFDTALWTHRNLENTVTVATEETRAYYALQATESGVYTATATSSNCVITVYDQNRSAITTTGTGSSVSWSVTSGTRYYVVIYGELTMSFTVAQQ